MSRTIATLLLLALTSCQPRPEICEPGGPCSSTWAGLPSLRRTESVREVTPLMGATVRLAPAGIAGWRIQIANETDVAMSVLLDESTFVTSGGESGGRLIGGNTRRIDTAKAQPAAPLAPHATYGGVVLVEELLWAEEAEEGNQKRASDLDEMRLLADGKSRLGEDLVAMTTKNRKNVAKLVIGGKLYITVATADGKQTWTGEVVPNPEEHHDASSTAP